ncbi:MAG: PLP-dependent aminotransferase family protein [Methanoregula sp.]|jgi:2-aminoadipate transaminase
MTFAFSRRIQHAPVSFLGELFRVSSDPSIISFAGGLPSSELIDTEGLSSAAQDVFSTNPRTALQYSTTDGYRPLREYIADRYHSRLGIPATADEIQITNGSQQCLDLFAKIFLDPGDRVGMERPGYLGAIEAFSLYEPDFVAVPLDSEGPDPVAFRKMIKDTPVKFFYGIPNCQNPSGCTYSQERRKEIAEILSGTETVFYEDDAFGELFFDGTPRLPVKRFLAENAVISGSFSKITAPGMRIGWLYAPGEILKEFNIAKQAADLHSNFLCQQILHRYLVTNDLDSHIRKIVAVYRHQCRLMCDLLDELMPSLSHTTPEGGMFLTAELPVGLHAMKVFEEGIREKVAVLPGMPFFVDGGGTNIIRLNFSNADEERITEGMHRLMRVVDKLSPKNLS